MFIGLLSVCSKGRFGESLASNYEGCIKYVSLNNRPCQARPILVNINSIEPVYDPFTVTVNKLAAVVIPLMIYMLEYMFQIKFKIGM